MDLTEYSATEMDSLLKSISGMYDLARVVDPSEGRILEFHPDGRISMNESCYGIWGASHKCANCSSSIACGTGRRRQKTEYFENQVYHVQSNPVKLRLQDGETYDAVLELVNIEEQRYSGPGEHNDRAAENVAGRAAEYRATHDSLTEVLTANAFYEVARKTLVGRPSTTWVMVTGDIMDFRLVNTLFGVTRGNEFLVGTASALDRIARDADGLCGRLGGDQFALLVPEERFDEEVLAAAAKSLASSFNSGIYTFRIHFGVCVVEDASIPVSVMCGRANSALRTIHKSLTRTVAHFDDEIFQQSLLDHEIISKFHTALQDDQFRMYLQPIVTDAGRTIGAEALVRWIRKDGTLVEPGGFVETLERAGLIHLLDMHMWELAVRQLSAWEGTDKEDLTISVNMSAKDFYSVDIFETLTNLVDTYHVDSGKLRLEITETAFIEGLENSQKVIAKLRERGFLVEIDDFGKGYSSLGLLKDIRADVLKIDLSLLREMERRRRSHIIVQAVIGMSQQLGMTAIAEGVETRQQFESLVDMGCDLFQGYYFSRPVPVETFEAALAIMPAGAARAYGPAAPDAGAPLH